MLTQTWQSCHFPVSISGSRTKTGFALAHSRCEERCAGLQGGTGTKTEQGREQAAHRQARAIKIAFFGWLSYFVCHKHIAESSQHMMKSPWMKVFLILLELHSTKGDFRATHSSSLVAPLPEVFSGHGVPIFGFKSILSISSPTSQCLNSTKTTITAPRPQSLTQILTKFSRSVSQNPPGCSFARFQAHRMLSKLGVQGSGIDRSHP